MERSTIFHIFSWENSLFLWPFSIVMSCNKLPEGIGIYIYILSAQWDIYIYTGWWVGTFGLFSHILGRILPTDFHIFQRGRAATNQKNWVDYHDRTLFSRSLESWFIAIKSSPNGCKIQVSEILLFTQIIP